MKLFESLSKALATPGELFKKYKIVKIWGESTHKRGAKQVIDYCDTLEEFKNIVAVLEDANWFPEENHWCAKPNIFAYDQQGNEVYDSKYPETIDYTDYQYTVEEVTK